MSTAQYNHLGVEWRPAEPGLLPAVVARFAARPESVPPSVVVRVRAEVADLPFYSGHRLVRLSRSFDDGELRHCFVLHSDSHSVMLDGQSAPIHDVNALERVQLSEAVRPAYLRLFFFFVRGDEGSFTLLEDAGIVIDAADGQDAVERENLKAAIAPLRSVEDKGDTGTYAALVHYGASAFSCDVSVSESGLVEMLDDQQAFPSVPAEWIQRPPRLHLIHEVVGSLLEPAGEAVPPSAANVPDRPGNDREVTRRFVAELLQHALGPARGHVLLRCFNPRSDADYPLLQLARFLTTAWPVVVIESETAFVEELIADLLVSQPRLEERTPLIRGAADSEGVRLRFDNELRDRSIVLLPLHAYASVADVDRIAHEIAVREVAVLIGCRQLADVPEPLRRATDLVLRLPVIDAVVFRGLFRRILCQDLPARWRQGGSGWVRYVLATDFHQVAKLGLPPARALRYVRERVQQRLGQVDPRGGPGLADLHGMAEARQLAEDLIADIQAARAGRIGWKEVDRGMLLAGPPGTGKTTLARAIAKDCGVKFIAASAASWQAAGHLGDHIRAMRSSFDEARRYAPSILFIDEIDSIGSREGVSGPNAQYHTEVVNALLELMQGLDVKAPVFVIAATNFPERIDPALRRAGRLDRVVEIPYPNVDGLAAIFGFHLREHVAAGNLASDVDTRILGALAFGLTGADVESFVRGAARRARKAGRAIGQVDLVAEITGKPRSESSGSRLTDRDMRIVAVHEAGHALARHLNNGQGHQVAFVSIVPRADGTLGFVASLPSENQLMTRSDYMELLEVCLAGRAAEDLVFGADQVSNGAGGESRRSDLAAATRIATTLVCRQAMGGASRLTWSDTPNAGQNDQIEQILVEAFAVVSRKLEAHRDALGRLTDALIDRQELTGDEVRAILDVG